MAEMFGFGPMRMPAQDNTQLRMRRLPATAPMTQANTGYTGSLHQQYEQALGVQPRYVSPNAGTQRLNRLYDQSFGYTPAPPAAVAPQLADTYMTYPQAAPLPSSTKRGPKATT